MIVRRSVLWVGMNIAGVALFLYLGARLWVLPGEEGTPGGPGDAFYWVLTLFPVLVAFLIFNTIVLVAIVRRVRTTQDKRPLLVCLAVAVLWLAAVGYDHHRSFRVIDAQYGFLHVQHIA